MQLRCQVLKDTALMAAMTMDLQLPKGRWHEVSWEVDSHGPMQAISFGHLFFGLTLSFLVLFLLVNYGEFIFFVV